MNNELSEPDQFLDLVDAWVEEAVRSGVSTFESLVGTLPGVYPDIVRHSLLRLQSNPKGHFYEALLPRGLQPLSLTSTNAPLTNLPVPHPLDYDWRFARAAADALLDRALSFSILQGDLVLIGAPSMVSLALKRWRHSQVVVIDTDRPVVDALRSTAGGAQVYLCDVLREQLPVSPNSAGVVIVDPPWYPDDLYAFLWCASWLCRPSGYVLASLPPVGTRPGIREERAVLVEMLPTLGLTLIRIEEGALPYLSPLFERNALRACGIDSAPLDWRRGDLAILVHDRKQGQRPAAPTRADAWLESATPGFRVRLRDRTAQRPSDPTLKQIVDRDVLPTVSRRDPRRQHVDVWTSGNRVFSCQDTGILRQVFEERCSGNSSELRRLLRSLDAEEASLVERARTQVAALIHVEQQEQSHYLDLSAQQESRLAY